MLFPGNQSSFWVPEDILFEAQFSRPVHTTPTDRLTMRAEMVSRNMFLYNVLAPTPIEGKRLQPSGDSLISFKTYNENDGTIASYEGLANLPLIVWGLLLLTSLILFIKNIRSDNAPLLYGILGGLAFNFFLHMNYGTELFLYTANWTFLIVFFVALSLKTFATQTWFQASMVIFLLAMFANNVRFLSIILSGLAPYLGGG
jgi:hypothetical protein